MENAIGNSEQEERIVSQLPFEETHNQPQVTNGPDESASVGRTTISVVIDEDEEDDPMGETISDPAIHSGDVSPHKSTSYQDHTYITRMEQINSPPSQQSMDQNKMSQNFPILHGLNLEQTDDYGIAPVLPKINQAQRQTVRRLPSNGGGGYGIRDGYYKQQLQGGLRGPQKYVTAPTIQPKFISSPSFSQYHQEIPKRESQLPPTLRPAGPNHRSVTASLDTRNGSPIPVQTSNSSATTLYSQRRANYKDPDLQQEIGLSAPIIAPRIATRSHTSPAGSRIRQNSLQMNPLPAEHRFNEFHQIQDPHQYGDREFAPPPPIIEPQSMYSHRKRTASPNMHETQVYMRQPAKREQQHDTIRKAMEEEEVENEKFLTNLQQGHKIPVYRGRGRRPKKLQTEIADHDTKLQQQQESSKPPDDPVPCQQLEHHYSAVPTRQQTFYESSIDSAIDSVVRGDALVMQHLMQPTFTAPSTTSMPQYIQPQNTPTKPYYANSSAIPIANTVHQPALSPSSISNQRLEDLAELAQASSHLLQQTSSSMMRTPIYQQRQPYHPSQPTLHFKVVATSNQPETFPQESKQRVITVQQQHYNNNQETHHQIHDESIEQHRQPSSTKRTTKRLTKKQMESIEKEAAQILPSKIATIPPQEKSTPKRKTENKIKGRLAVKTPKKTILKKAKEVKSPVYAKLRRIERNSMKMDLVKKDRAQKEATTKKSTKLKDDTYVTRCICGMTHNDPFMIQCDGCDVWQHGICMDVSKKSVPEKYYCEQCKSRELKFTGGQAAATQKRYLASVKSSAQAIKKKLLMAKRKSAPAALKTKPGVRGIRSGRIEKKRISVGNDRKQALAGRIQQDSNKQNLDAAGDAEEGEFIPGENHYSRGVKALMAHKTDSKVGIGGLDWTVSGHLRARHLRAILYNSVQMQPGENFMELQRLKTIPLARQMYVAPNVEGLVATPGPHLQVISGTPLIEYIGMISLSSEIHSRTPNKLNQHVFTLFYNGLGEGNEFFVDATKIASIARSARRSCRPNTTIRHVILNGQLHLYLYATTNIDNSTEITIPFDFDYWDSKMPIECACGLNKAYAQNMQEARCPIQEFNEALKDPLNFQKIKALKKTELNTTASVGIEPARSLRSRVSLEAGPEPKIKKEIESPKREKMPMDQPKSSRLRPRNSSEAENLNATTTSLKSNVAPNKRKSPIKSKGTELELKASVKTEMVPTKIIESPQKEEKSSKKSTSGGLSTLASAYRRETPKAITQQVMPKRGRPPGSTKALKREIKEEIVPETPQKLSREERKVQAAIALVNSLEEHEQHKKRKSGPAAPSHIDDSTSKIKIQSSKELTDALDFKIIYEKFGREFRDKMNKSKISEDFALPANYAELRAKHEKVEKRIKKSPRKSENAPKIDAIIHVPSMKEEQKDKQQEQPKEKPIELDTNKTKIKTTHSQPPSAVPMTAEQCNVIASTSAETSRVPNTKAQKKITIDEYKRKRMAEIGSPTKQKASNVGGTSGESSQLPKPFTRQSPRKSFIPSIGSVPSPPQQLEDFPSLSPPRQPQNIPITSESPSLDELKKRILGNSGGMLPTPTELPGPSSARQQQQHPPLPDIAAPLPQKLAESQQQTRPSLDDRLRARFGKK